MVVLGFGGGIFTRRLYRSRTEPKLSGESNSSSGVPLLLDEQPGVLGGVAVAAAVAGWLLLLPPERVSASFLAPSLALALGDSRMEARALLMAWNALFLTLGDK